MTALASSFLVLFDDAGNGWDVGRLRRTLSEAGLSAVPEGAGLAVDWDGGPRLQASILDASAVTATLDAVDVDPAVQSRLAQADAGIRVDVVDLDAALDEINTLIEVQATLQDATVGVVYLGWNGAWLGSNADAG